VILVYQITRITDKTGAPKTDPDSRRRLGCMGEAKMQDGCVLIHCRYDGKGEPCDRYIRTSLVEDWKKDQDSGRIVIITANSIYTMDHVRT